MTADELELLVHGGHGHPHAVLGPHTHDGGVTVRVFRPLAKTVTRRLPGAKGTEQRRAGPRARRHLGRRAAGGGRARTTASRSTTASGAITVDDPYRFLPTPRRDGPAPDQRGPPRAAVDGARRAPAPLRGPRHRAVDGTSFAVWAPHAKGVRVKGDFNSWDGREHPMRQLGSSGVWELFVPDVGTGTKYKFLVLGADGQWREKADPMAFHTETPPATSSVVFESAYTWGDDEWMAHRGDRAGRARADVGLRDAPRLVEEALGRRRLLLPAARRRPGALPRRPRLHPRRVPAGHGAPVRRLVGLPGHVVLRADRAVRRPRRLPATSSTGCTRPASASSSTGCPRTSPRTSSRWPASTARRSTRTPTRRAASTPSGAPTSSTSAAARSATSWSPTRSTGSRSSTSTGCASTPSPRCSTSTTPARPASGRPTSTAAARTSRPCSSSRR